MGKKSITVGVRVDSELDDLLKAIAAKEDRSVSYIAREMILEGLKAKKLLKPKKKK